MFDEIVTELETGEAPEVAQPKVIRPASEIDLYPHKLLDRLQKIINRYPRSRRLEKEMERIFVSLNQLIAEHENQRLRNGIGVVFWYAGMNGRFAYIYKIGTPAVPNLYVGSTTDYDQRCKQHHSYYEFAHKVGPILNGSWQTEPYDVKIQVIEVCHANDRLKREEYWRQELRPRLNKRRAYRFALD